MELRTGVSAEGKKLPATAIVDRIFYLARFGIVGVPGSRFQWAKGRGMILQALSEANNKPGARLPPIDEKLVREAFGFSREV